MGLGSVGEARPDAMTPIPRSRAITASRRCTAVMTAAAECCAQALSQSSVSQPSDGGGAGPSARAASAMAEATAE